MQGKRILLGISGGIAAYKSCDLVRRLREKGAEVQIVMTDNAAHFVTATSLQALSGKAVRQSLWDASAEAAMSHIELARWADVLLIAPASADLLAKLAHGLAGDLLTTLCLASSAPLMIAPAMNQQMCAHAATQANLALLTLRGARQIGPSSGSQACGDVGLGRMAEVAEIVQAVEAALSPATKAIDGILAGKNIWITAGPTREALDPVRFISNLSSGKMGFALAQAAHMMGANVTLVSGPVALSTPVGVTRIDVESAIEMQAAVQPALRLADWFIGAAAVADYRAKVVAPQKIKKTLATLEITLVKNPDIIGELALKRAEIPRTPEHSLLLIGFAAETQDVLAQAEQKRVRKQLDFILANQVGPGLGMETPDNELWLLGPALQIHFPRADKASLARAVLAQLLECSLERER
jgi:phosphopantothenoylcysteine decarboxylase / phosphopantothenate---cysteine ligase